MFDKLEELVEKLNSIHEELLKQENISNQEKFTSLMKEESEIKPIVDKYIEYKEYKQTISDSEELLNTETDEEMRDMLKEELSSAKDNLKTCEQELKILLLPKDPNDDKNVIIEIRAGAGGDEAALFAAEIYRMYCRYAERYGYKTEMIIRLCSGKKVWIS